MGSAGVGCGDPDRDSLDAQPVRPLRAGQAGQARCGGADRGGAERSAHFASLSPVDPCQQPPTRPARTTRPVKIRPSGHRRGGAPAPAPRVRTTCWPQRRRCPRRSDDRVRWSNWRNRSVRSPAGWSERRQTSARRATAQAVEPGPPSEVSSCSDDFVNRAFGSGNCSNASTRTRATADPNLLGERRARIGTRPRETRCVAATAGRCRGQGGRRGAESCSGFASRREIAGPASDRRLELLLGALEGAASGLRREWDLVGGGPLPGDVVAAGLPQRSTDADRTSTRHGWLAWAGIARRAPDRRRLQRHARPAYPELSLSEQRDRLVRSLAALAARTSAEMTVVFDGAAVATARPRRTWYPGAVLAAGRDRRRRHPGPGAGRADRPGADRGQLRSGGRRDRVGSRRCQDRGVSRLLLVGG